MTCCKKKSVRIFAWRELCFYLNSGSDWRLSIWEKTRKLLVFSAQSVSSLFLKRTLLLHTPHSQHTTQNKCIWFISFVLSKQRTCFSVYYRTVWTVHRKKYLFNLLQANLSLIGNWDVVVVVCCDDHNDEDWIPLALYYENRIVGINAPDLLMINGITHALGITKSLSCMIAKFHCWFYS